MSNISIGRMWSYIRFFIALATISYILIDAKLSHAGKPSILSQASGDTSEVDSVFTKIWDVSSDVGFGIGGITFGVGIVLLSPLFGGRSEAGFNWMKSGAGILVLAGLAKIIIAFFGNLSS